MTNPVLMVVDRDPGSLATLDDTLRRRYGHDYLIISEATPETALGRGFILTGSDLPASGDPAASWALPRPPHPLETSMPGVFAAGDVRHGSVKRVASAVGEGSIATTQLSQYLQTQARNSQRQGIITHNAAW